MCICMKVCVYVYVHEGVYMCMKVCACVYLHEGVCVCICV